MKTNSLILYFYGKTLFFNYKDIDYKSNFKSINEGKIVDILLFRQEFAYLLKKNNINNNLIGDNLLYITINDSYLELEMLNEIFKEFNFKNVLIIPLEKFLDNHTYLFISRNVVVVSKNYKTIINSCDKKVVELFLLSLVKENKIKNDLYIIKENNDELGTYLKDTFRMYSIYNPKDYIFAKFLKKVTKMWLFFYDML